MRPILIAGPTASGKSALALALAQRLDATILNADALQVYAGWRILTARPSVREETLAPHRLYGHVPNDAEYSTGHWLREVRAQLATTPRTIIVGGTGLNFAALTDGLADIPPTPPAIRAEADARDTRDILADLKAEDPSTLARIDTANPARLQRAWEVLRTTGQGLSAWHALTPPPLLALSAAQPVVLRPDIAWLNERITRRFATMLDTGALDEARAALPDWDPTRPAARAIGAPELIAYLRGEITLEHATARAITASKQYAKRQRTWLRNRMKTWHPIVLDATTDLQHIADRLAQNASGGRI